jgi:hypothetical protein
MIENNFNPSSGYGSVELHPSDNDDEGCQWRLKLVESKLQKWNSESPSAQKDYETLNTQLKQMQKITNGFLNLLKYLFLGKLSERKENLQEIEKLREIVVVKKLRCEKCADKVDAYAAQKRNLEDLHKMLNTN